MVYGEMPLYKKIDALATHYCKKFKQNKSYSVLVDSELDAVEVMIKEERMIIQ